MRIRHGVAAAVVLVTAAALSWGLYSFIADKEAEANTPSCSWSVQVHGANKDQDGLIRCYLRAEADHSADEMSAVAESQDWGGPKTFTAADFAHSKDARSGTASVTVSQGDVDTADAAVRISYADGVVDTLEIHVLDPESAHSWRVWNLGPQDDSGPPPAQF